MASLVVIPARHGSTRFPGKPLAPIAGVAMVQRVWALARAGAPEARVIVATDDDAIARFVAGFGGEAMLTDPALADGTARAAAVAAALGDAHDWVLNLQGDAVLTPPWVIAAMIAQARDPAVAMATPATAMARDALDRLVAVKAAGEVGGTTVAFDRAGDALYFSKSVIPFVRDAAGATVFRHIGLYAYRPDTLARLVTLPAGPLELAERLEQLRALENGIRIRVVPVDYRGRTHWGVDTREDLARCEALIAAEGELLAGYDGRARA